MTEHAESNAFAAIVSRLGTLSESELRQLYLVVGVRLGIPEGSVPGKTGKTSKQPAAGKTGSGGAVSKKSSGQSAKRGNPQRKSQWANHPLYQEYSRLKKVVESQAKEAKTSFNSVDTAESRAYNEVFIQWMETKSSFRDRKTDTKDDDSDDESEVEGKGKQVAVKQPPAPAAKSNKAGPSTSQQAKPAGSPPLTSGAKLPVKKPSPKATPKDEEDESGGE